MESTTPRRSATASSRVPKSVMSATTGLFFWTTLTSGSDEHAPRSATRQTASVFFMSSGTPVEGDDLLDDLLRLIDVNEVGRVLDPVERRAQVLRPARPELGRDEDVFPREEAESRTRKRPARAE